MSTEQKSKSVIYYLYDFGGTGREDRFNQISWCRARNDPDWRLVGNSMSRNKLKISKIPK